MSQILGAEFGVASTTDKHGVGTTTYKIESDGIRSTYIWMQADGAVIADTPYNYDAATFQIEDKADAGAVPLDGDTCPICFSPIALADNEYGWVFVGPGKFSAITDATGIAAATDGVYVSATVGTLSSGATGAPLHGVNAEAIVAAGATGTFYAANRLYLFDLP